ncbi:MAG: hypothetical protein KA781_07400 [Aquabacterium sp.]|jgi:membrane-bound inhibitor of C-type lysozyme|nr:hypothetical protein [Aquabacterium sp.]
MKLNNWIVVSLCSLFLSACGGGGSGGASDSEPSGQKNPLSKYAGTYYACDDHEFSVQKMVVSGSDSLSVTLETNVHQNENCTGPIVGKVVVFPVPLVVKYVGVGTATMPPFSLLPYSDAVETVSVSAPAMTPQLTGSGVNGLCVNYVGGNICYEPVPTAVSMSGALYLKGDYVVSFSLENGVLTADQILSKDPSFNSKNLTINANANANDLAIDEAKKQVASRMKDPASTVFKNLVVYRVDSDATVCGEFNAKNGFGAYVGYKRFYYRPSASGMFGFVYQTDSTGTNSFVINSATNTLIDTVCSDVTKDEADAAENLYIKTILP